MELHSFNAKFTMPKAHDCAVVGFGGYFELARERFALDYQRMIARPLKFLRQAAKNGFAVVRDTAGLAVHYFTRTNHTPAKRRSDRLMAQAHTKNRNFAGEALDQRNADSRFLRRAWPGRNHDALRPHFVDFVERDAAVAAHFELLPHLTKVLREVIGKRVVVVEQQ